MHLDDGPIVDDVEVVAENVFIHFSDGTSAVFSEAHAFGPGHNGFFKSPDGKQDWIIYHANPEPHQGCGNHRSTRVQPFTWNTDGIPNFDKPAPVGVLPQKSSSD